MRLLALGISALALGACSVGGGYSWNGGNAGYDQATTASYGHSGSYNSGYGHAPSPCNVNPCGSYTPPAPQPAPCYVNPCAPVYQPQPPVYIPPPAPKPTPPVAPCYNPCAGGTYDVSPYAYNTGHSASHYASTPDAHAYGTHSAPHQYTHGYYGAEAPKSDYFYGTLGAVWYNVDDPIGGVQGRLGYMGQAGFGVEVEGSVGVISDTNTVNVPNPPGPDLVGESKDGVKHSFGGFAVARMPLGSNFSAHARVGYHTTKAYNEVTAGGTTVETTTTRDGVAFGAGMELMMTPVDAIRADFTRYQDSVDGADSVSLAYLRRF